MKRALIVLIILLVLGGGGGAFYWFKYGSAQAATQAPPSAKVERGSLRIAVSSTGTVYSNQDIDIKCKASGTVIKLPYDISDEVKKDAVVLQLDTIDEDRAVAKAQATVDASEAQLAQARQELEIAKANLVTSRMKAEATSLAAENQQRDTHTKLERTRALLEKHLASQEDYDTAANTAAQSDATYKLALAAVQDLKAQELGIGLKEKSINLQEANLAADKINLDIQKQLLAYTTVTSPIDGVVSSLTSGTNPPTRIGTLVQSGTSNVSGGTTVMTISDLSHIFVYANVDESDIGQVARGQKVLIHADAFPGRNFEGEVVRIATQGKSTSNVVTFEVRIEVTSPNKRLLRPVMTANVDIINTEKPDILLVPIEAVTRAKPAARPGNPGATTQSSATQTAALPPGTRPGEAASQGRQRPGPGTVSVLKPDGTTESRDVVVGLSDFNNYEVVSGLAEGETVVLNKSAGESRWRPNMGGMRMMGGGGGGGRGR